MSEKLYQRISDFNKLESFELKEIFNKLASGQRPDALFIGCSDSRVMPALFSKSDPGELFMVRNVGNLIPRADSSGNALGDESEASAIEYALEHLLIDDIVVCGHSGCGAMNALHAGRSKIHAPNLKSWLRHADHAFKFKGQINFDDSLSEVDQLSQANILLQLENVKTYPVVSEMLAQNKLRLHAWWIDITTSQVYSYSQTTNKFEII